MNRPPPRRPRPGGDPWQRSPGGRDAAPRAPSPRERREAELRLFGVSACRAVFARRPQAIRKIWLTEQRVPAFRDVLAACAAQRVGYRVVANEDLERLTQSTHHEGVCFDVLRPESMSLDQLLERKSNERGGSATPAPRPSLTLWLDGVGNPHNLGAVLRIAAHFGADAVLVPRGGGAQLSGAACRVAEGGAEVVPLVVLDDPVDALRRLERAGFGVYATVVRPEPGADLHATAFPARSVVVFGAETAGTSAALLRAVPKHLFIPGTGAVDSLNIATAAAVIVAEFRRQHPLR
ncbi:MAG TPA: TrmH family RNA methyltransferase [Xanthomonadales bacterium]|nr:TrmH family RNA methyltransferase [Xanthomonadales bacterium]